MYNKIYTSLFKFIGNESTEPMYSSGTCKMSTDYWCADSFKYDVSFQGYTLVNPYKISSTTEYSNLIGKYTFLSADEEASTLIPYHIVRVDNSTGYYVSYDPFNINYTYTYGDSYTYNEDGTYTINNPTTIKQTELYYKYSDMSNKYVCENATNNTCNDLRHIKSATQSDITYTTPFYNNAYKYSNGFKYESGDGSKDNPYIVSGIGDEENLPPEVSCSLDKGLYEDFQTLTITATDDDFDYMNVKVLYEGKVVKELKNVFTNTVDIELNKKGTWTISVIAYDEAGNTQKEGPLINGKTYINYIIGEGENLYETTKKKAVLDNISSEFVTSPTGINFNQIAIETNGKGLYIRRGTENNTYPVYYYRGNVDDNNVIFGGYCWKIVRTTDTGGTKLIYNGEPIDGKCSNTSSSYIGSSAFNASSTSPADFGYMYGERYDFDVKHTSQITNGMIFGNDVEYKNNVYTLKDTYTLTNGWSNDKSTISSKYHYTCFTTDNNCSEVYYIYNIASDNAYYTILNSGKNIDDVLYETTSGSTNEHDSEVKKYIDNWYSINMVRYTDYLEDTIWCNDRSTYMKNGWDKDTDNSTSLSFGAKGRRTASVIGNFMSTSMGAGGDNDPILSCPNKNDSFTVGSSGNGKLKYPIGLITGDELVLAGGGNGINTTSSYLSVGSSPIWWWIMSPMNFSEGHSNSGYIVINGRMYITLLEINFGVRPMISLKNSNIISGGDGTADNPYIVFTK